MQKAFMKMTLAVLASALTACSSMQGMPTMPGFETGSEGSQQQQGLVGTSVDQTGKETNVNITMAGGGEIGLKSMDANDKTKMSRALDAATGKATHWENGISGINYTVTPIRKVVIQGNPFCREYQVMVVKGQYRKEVHGTACVTTDGSWHTI